MKRLVLTEEEKNRILGLHGSNIILEAANPKVSQIQTYLKTKGHNLGTTGPNKDGVDGLWGKKTKDAVKAEFGIDIDETGNVASGTASTSGTTGASTSGTTGGSTSGVSGTPSTPQVGGASGTSGQPSGLSNDVKTFG
jgi:hypothetical protein